MLWVAATLQQEWIGRLAGGGVSFGKLRGVAIDLATNPIVFAVLAGSLWRFTGLGLLQPLDSLLGLLGQGAVPGALFSLGFGLTRFEVRADARVLAVIVGLKLMMMPLIGWVIARYVLNLPPIGTETVTLLAACPTGANAYLFASRYDRALGPVSGAIAAGTAIGALTMTLTLLLLSSG